MDTTTIQVEKDVRERLEEEKIDEKETLNAVIGRLLKIDRYIEKPAFCNNPPNRFIATIWDDQFRNNDSCNDLFMKALALSEDEMDEFISGYFDTEKTIDGVKVVISLRTTLEVEIASSKQDRLLEKLVKIRPIMEPITGKFSKENFRVDACYCMSREELKEWSGEKQEET